MARVSTPSAYRAPAPGVAPPPRPRRSHLRPAARLVTVLLAVLTAPLGLFCAVMGLFADTVDCPADMGLVSRVTAMAVVLPGLLLLCVPPTVLADRRRSPAWSAVAGLAVSFGLLAELLIAIDGPANLCLPPA